MLLELPIALGLIGGTLGWFGAALLHRTEQSVACACSLLSPCLALLMAAHATAKCCSKQRVVVMCSLYLRIFLVQQTCEASLDMRATHLLPGRQP